MAICQDVTLFGIDDKTCGDTVEGRELIEAPYLGMDRDDMASQGLLAYDSTCLTSALCTTHSLRRSRQRCFVIEFTSPVYVPYHLSLPSEPDNISMLNIDVNARVS